MVRFRSWATDRSLAGRFVNSLRWKRSAGGFKGEARRSFAGKAGRRNRGNILFTDGEKGKGAWRSCWRERRHTLAGKVAPDRPATELECPCLPSELITVRWSFIGG